MHSARSPSTTARDRGHDRRAPHGGAGLGDGPLCTAKVVWHNEAVEHPDVIIIGAGLSGVGAAVHLRKRCPGKSYLILEGRQSIGGTWDLFRYPGVRSDSDMHTLGYSFKPWRESKAIADGPSILSYVKETAAEYGLDTHIRYEHLATKAVWSSTEATWSVEALRKDTGDTVRFTCNFLVICAGYYS
jgi:monooxygenase